MARFKREEAYGDGVVLEWFFLISKEIFYPKRKLFTVSLDDRRRYRPNHASFVDEDYLKKFKFVGLVIDLAYLLSQFSWKVGALGSGKKSHSLKV